MSQLPLISIIIPVYNHQKELLLALESIKKQTWKNLEVIIIDDGSEQPISYKLQVTSYRIFWQENKGAPAARNKGLEMSKGEYVIFWDADIVAEPEMLEKMHQALQNNPQASYAYCNHVSCIMYHVSKKIPAKEFHLEELKMNNYIHSTSLIRRKDAIKWDESLKRFQDWDLWLTMAEQGKKGVWIDEYLFRIISQGTMSRWLPSFAYKKPWKWLPGIKGKVKKYEEAKRVVMKKQSG